MLKIDQLRCFLAAADAGSIAGAGAALNLSPSAINYSIGALEDRLDAKLFLRRPSSGVSLTADGRRLMARARPLIRDVVEIEEIFPRGNGALSGELIVGCQEGLSWSLAPRAIERVLSDHPRLDIRLKTVFMDDGNLPLTNGEVDVLLTFEVEDVADDRIDREILCRPASYAMMRKGHPLDTGEATVRLEDLAAFPQLLLRDGPAFDLFSGMYAQRGLAPAPGMVINISTSAQALVGSSDSVSLRIVRPAHDRCPLGQQLIFIPIANDVRRAMLVASSLRRKNGSRPVKVEKLVQACRSLFDEGVMRSHLFY